MTQTPFDQLVAALIQARSRRQLAGRAGLLLVGVLRGSESVIAGKKHKHHKKPKHPKDHCEDGETNFGETDVDCGGPCPRRCDLGQFCARDLDCTTGICELVEEIDTQRRVCAACRLDSDCPGTSGGTRCVDNRCAECAADFDCPTVARPFCVALARCPNTKPCACAQCRTDTDCPASICDETNTCFHCGHAQGIGIEGCSCVPDGEPCTLDVDTCCSPSSTCVARNEQNICFD
jgi:hypothetical protein